MASDNELYDIRLRDVEMSDLPIFFEHQLDSEANYMAAFTNKDPTNREAFIAHWTRNIGNIDNQVSSIQTILCNGQVVGHVSSYPAEDESKPEVTYWLDKAYWGRGIATRALVMLLARIQERPVYGRVAADNPASLRVLEKCGFVRTGTDRGFANARGQVIEEILLRLN